MHAAGSVRVLFKDISETMRSISWPVVVVIARGTVVGKSESVEQKAPVCRPPGSIPEGSQERVEDQGDDSSKSSVGIGSAPRGCVVPSYLTPQGVGPGFLQQYAHRKNIRLGARERNPIRFRTHR